MKDSIVTSLLSQNLPILKGDLLNSFYVNDNVESGVTTYFYENGLPWSNTFKTGIEQSDDLVWSSETNFPVTAIGRGNFVIIKNKFYTLNIYETGSYTQPLYEADIDSNGNLGTITSTRKILYDGADARTTSGSIVYTKNYIYLGGYHWYGSGSYAPNYILRMSITNGIPSLNWISGIVSDPNSSEGYAMILYKGYIYTAGGNYAANSGYVRDTVYSSKVNDDGTINPFIQTTSLPQAQTSARFFIVGDSLYLSSGTNNGSTYYKTIYKVIFNENNEITGYTDISNPIPINTYAFDIIVTANCVYLFCANGNVYKAIINQDDTFGLWELSGTTAMTGGIFILTSSKLYHTCANNTNLKKSTPFLGGKNDYSDDVYYTVTDYTFHSGIWYSLSKDGETYNSYINGSWKPIASVDDSVHGHTGETYPYYWDDDTSEWVYIRGTMQEAISEAMRYEGNRMIRSTLNGLSNFSSVFDSATGEVYLAVSMFTDGTEKPELINISLNNKGYWISDEYQLDDYVATITSASVSYGFSPESNTVDYLAATKLYCLRSDQSAWVECINGAIPNLPNGLVTSGISVRFRVVWDKSVWTNPGDIFIEFILK